MDDWRVKLAGILERYRPVLGDVPDDEHLHACWDIMRLKVKLFWTERLALLRDLRTQGDVLGNWYTAPIGDGEHGTIDGVQYLQRLREEADSCGLFSLADALDVYERVSTGGFLKEETVFMVRNRRSLPFY